MRNAEVIRQWQILREVEARRTGVTIHELAKQVKVSTRTIRRDLQALQEAGFAIYDEGEENETKRWRLNAQPFKSVQDGLSVGLLVISAVGGWGIGAALRRSVPSRLLGLALGTGAWLLSLVLTWLVTRVTLLSDRPLDERLAQTPFLDFTAQQFGLLDVLSLALFAGAAWIGARRTSRAA